MPRKEREPYIFAGRMHDRRGPFGSILSVACEGPGCLYCQAEREAKGRIKQEAADREIAVMAAVLADLEQERGREADAKAQPQRA